MTTEYNVSMPEEQKHFPADTQKDMQVKIVDHVQDVAGNIVAVNKNTDECYEKAPTMEIAIEDFDFYMQVFDNYEKDKKKRAECQRKYFENNKKTYYERQKKWRDGHKLDLNKKRRDRYHAQQKLKKLAITCDELPPPPSVPLEKVEQEQEPASVDELEHQRCGKDGDEASH